jgi:hypothetical protein
MGDLMTSQFNAAASVAAREDAITRVDDAASALWKAQALDAVRCVALIREQFTTDAVWFVLEKCGIAGPREPRALGAVMRRAVTEGFCTSTGEVSKSIRTGCHRRPLAVWKSCIYRQQAAGGWPEVPK